nr:immunoglobulin heavy chain junction region [Mus musculus]MBK4195488.1 immunoglobulin heavy chain junction region [Mus musculus]
CARYYNNYAMDFW